MRSHTLDWAICAAATRDIEGYQLTLLGKQCRSSARKLDLPGSPSRDRWVIGMRAQEESS